MTSKIIPIADLSGPLLKDRIKVRCGDCTHFQGTSNPTVADVVCSKNGVLATKLAPPCFSADVSSLRVLGPDMLGSLHTLLTATKPKQMRIIIGLLGNASSLERVGLSFLEEVFFYVGDSADSLENLYRGYALAALPDKQVSIIGGSILTGKNRSCNAIIYRDRLLTRKKFEAHVKRLSREGRIEAPTPRRLSALSLSEDLGVPTMDTSLEEMERRAKKGLKKTKGKMTEEADEILKPKKKSGNTLFSIGA